MKTFDLVAFKEPGVYVLGDLKMDPNNRYIVQSVYEDGGVSLMPLAEIQKMDADWDYDPGFDYAGPYGADDLELIEEGDPDKVWIGRAG